MLNETQRQVLADYLKFSLSDILENEDVSPRQELTVMRVLYEIFNSGTYNLYNQHRQTFNTLDILDSINQIIAIYKHPYPQNRTTNYPYFDAPTDNTMIVYKNQNGVKAFEKKGLLGLSARNDNTSAPVTKKDVIRFICNILQHMIEDPSFTSSKKFKKQAEENYALAKTAIFKRKHNEAIRYLFIAKRNFRELKRSGINCDTMLRKIKDKLTELQSHTTSRRSIRPALPAQPPPPMRRFSLRNINPKCIKTLKGHSDSVRSVCFNHDSTLVVSGSDDSTIKIWDVTTGKCIRTLAGHSKSVNSVHFNHDSTLIVSGSGSYWIYKAEPDNTVRIWDAITGKCIRTLVGYSYPVKSVRFNHNSTLIVSGGIDGTKIWEVGSGKCIKCLFAGCACFNHDSTLVCCGGGGLGHSICPLSTKTYKASKVLRGPSPSVNSICFNYNSTLIASGGYDNNVQIWDTITCDLIKILKGHSKEVKSVCFNHNSTLIASESDDKTIRIWDVNTGKCIKTLKGHYSVCFNHDSTLIVSGSHDKIIKIWRLNT